MAEWMPRHPRALSAKFIHRRFAPGTGRQLEDVGPPEGISRDSSLHRDDIRFRRHGRRQRGYPRVRDLLRIPDRPQVLLLQGSWVHNNPGRKGPQQNWALPGATYSSPEIHNICALANLVQGYLTNELRPHDLGAGEVGYHVAGFLPTGHPQLWTLFYGWDSPPQTGQQAPEYRSYTHTVPQHGVNFHYNGRNDLAHILIATAIKEAETARDIRFDFASPIDLVRFADLILRFASEVTPQVGPPFIAYAIAPGNLGVSIVNSDMSPLSGELIVEKLSTIGVA